MSAATAATCPDQASIRPDNIGIQNIGISTSDHAADVRMKLMRLIRDKKRAHWQAWQACNFNVIYDGEDHLPMVRTAPTS